MMIPVKLRTEETPSNYFASKSSFLGDVKEWLCGQAVFAWQYILNPSVLGTPFVCSPFVAKELLKHVQSSENDPPRNYIDAGAGTGAMTTYFVKKLRPGKDKLHIIEINEKLCEILKKKFGHLPNVYIHNKALQEWEPPTELKSPTDSKPTPIKFDAIVSTIPLNSLPSGELLKKIFDSYERLIKPNGIISSVEYAGITTVCKLCFFGEKRKQLDLIIDIKNEFIEKYGLERRIVWANLPPGRATHCKVATSVP